MKKQELINSERRPVPTAPYAKSITVKGTECKVGSSVKKETLPTEHLIKGKK